jgi:superfamily II DNA or RNA helicase
MAPTPLTHPHHVAAHIAHLLLPHSSPAQLGDITLAPHQQTAVARLLTLLQQHAGALLADDVGTGKTFIALGVAAHYHTPVILAPAALKNHWRTALARTRQSIPVHSIQQLSLSPPPAAVKPDLVIIDEAHHLRTPATHRYRHIAQFCQHAHVLLLSATPIHNRLNDLHHLLALFNTTLTPAHITSLIVRRTHTPALSTHISARPRVYTAPPLSSINTPNAPDISRAITTLPLPTPSPITALLHLSLLRHWMSSAGALLHALSTLRSRLVALDLAIEQGTRTDAHAIARQLAGPDTLQLGLLDALHTTPTTTTTPPRGAVQDALHAVLALRTQLATIASAHDHARALQLIAIRDHHAPAPIIAFSQFTSTVHALSRALRHTPGVATLTGTRAAIASGPLPRSALLRLIAPRAQHAPAPPPHQQLSLLLTTDALSEGLDLSDASAVIHLDLPWTDTRLAQRVGRIARLGSPHLSVTQYHCQSSAAAEQSHAQLERLIHKQRSAEAIIGPSAIPTLHRTDSTRTRHAAHHESVRDRITRRAQRWATATPTHADRTPQSAFVPLRASEATCAIGIVLHGEHRVVACSARPARRLRVGASLTLLDDVTRRLDHALQHGARDLPHDAALTRRITAGLCRWSVLHSGHWAARTPATGPVQHKTIIAAAARTIDRVVDRLPVDQRLLMRPHARAARDALARVRSVASLRALAGLLERSPTTGSVADVREWLARYVAVAPTVASTTRATEPPRVTWLLIGVPRM